MLSLSNAFNEKDMEDFLKKINNFLNTKMKKLELISEPKIDGISASLIYEKGVLVKGSSRGDGYVGEDILENLKTIKEIPQKELRRESSKTIEIRCEIYIGKKDFQKLKINLLIQEMQREGLYVKKIQILLPSMPLKYFAYGLGKIEPYNFKTQNDFLKR